MFHATNNWMVFLDQFAIATCPRKKLDSGFSLLLKCLIFKYFRDFRDFRGSPNGNCGSHISAISAISGAPLGGSESGNGNGRPQKSWNTTEHPQ